MKAPCLACKSKNLTIEIATETVEKLKAENEKLREALEETQSLLATCLQAIAALNAER